MAVNDLMMRIQLIVDSGRSSAELNRIQRSLADLNKSLKSLENTKISVLSNSLESLKSAASSLRSVNLQNFTRTIDEVKKSFSGLGATTQGLDNLKTAFQQLSQQANANSLKQYQSDLKKVTARLREAKQLTLTSAGASSNPNYLQLTSDLARYNKSLILSTKEIVDQRREVLRLKNDLSSISKVKFDSNLVLELSKLNNNRNLRNQPLSVIDRTTIGNLQDYNSKLSENQKSLLVANSKAEGYRQTLAKLRLAAQRFAIPDLTVGGTRNLVTDLNAAQSAIAQLRTSGIIPLENSIRSLQAKSSFNKVLNIDPIRANVRLARAELALLSNEASKQLIVGGKDDPTYLNKKKRIKDINEQILKDNLQIAQLEKQALTNINSKIARQQLSLAAKKNELALDKDQEQSIKALIAQQKQSAQLAAQAVKTRIFDITKSNNNIKSEANLYKQNLQALKQYLSERKAAAQVDIDAAKSQLYSAQVILAQKQLTKAEYAAERAEIKANMAIEKEKSRVYQEGLRANQQSLRESITAEREKTRSLLSDIRNARQLATEEGNIVKIRLQQELLQSRKGRTDLREQIKQTEDLTKVELNRLAVIERIANGGSRSSVNQNVGFAIKETQRIIDETTKRLGDLAVKSEAAKVKLGQIGTGSDLSTLNTKIKETVDNLKALKQGGLVGTISYGNMENQLANLREQRALLRQIAQIDLKTASGQVELKGLQQTINQLREAQREMSKLQQFARGFSQGFTFALQPDQLGMAAFNTLQQVLSELGRSFIQVNKETETLTRGLSAVFGAGQGEVQFEKLVGLANTYGLALHDLSRNYLSLNASSKGTILEGQESEKIFRSLSAAMAVLGADTITTQRAFRAVSQMISKGQVYAEELKGQLAEALPGAIQIFARSMGKTSQEFLAMVKAGSVGLNELIPFFQQVEQEYGKAATASTTYEQATNRLSNSWSLLMKKIGDTGAWQFLVTVIDRAAKSINSIIANAEIPIIEQLNKAKDKLNQFGEIRIPTKLEFDNLPEIMDGDKKFKIYGQFIVEGYDELVNKTREVNKYNKERRDAIGEEITALEKASRLKRLEEFDNEIESLKKVVEQYKTYEQFRKEYIRSLLESPGNKSLKSLFGFSDEFLAPPEHLIRQRYDAIYSSIAKQYQRLKELTKQRIELKVVTDEDDRTSEQTKLNKKYIKSITDELKIQQQAYSNLNTVQGKLTSNELKRLQASSGISSKSDSKLVVDEIKNTISLLNAQQALNRAREIESVIVTDDKNGKVKTRTEEANAIRNLTLQQLQHTMTLARASNSQSLILAIMQEQSRVMRDIRMTEAEFNPDVFTGLSTVSGEVKRDIDAINAELKASAQSTNTLVGKMSQFLSLTEQRDRLVKLQSNNQANRQIFEQQVGWEKELFDIETRRMSEKAKARRVLAVAEQAYAAAEAQLSIAKTSQDPAQIQQSTAAFNEISKVIESLQGKFEKAGSAGRAFIEKFSNLKVEAGQLALNFNDQALTAEIRRIDSLLEQGIGKDGKFNLDIGIKAATDNFNLLQNKYLEVKNKLEGASGENKTALEREIAQIVQQMAIAESNINQLSAQFKALNINKPIEFTISKEVQADLEALKKTMEGILLGSPLVFETQVDLKETEVRQKSEAARAIITEVMSKPIDVVVNIKTNTTTNNIASSIKPESSLFKDTAESILNFFLPAANAAEMEMGNVGRSLDDAGKKAEQFNTKISSINPKNFDLGQLEQSLKIVPFDYLVNVGAKPESLVNVTQSVNNALSTSAIKPVQVPIDTQGIQSRISEIKARLEELQSAQQTGIINPNTQEITRLYSELANLQQQLKSTQTVAQQPITPTINTQSVTTATDTVKNFTSEVSKELKPGYYAIEMRDSKGNLLREVQTTMAEANQVLAANKGKYSIEWSTPESIQKMKDSMQVLYDNQMLQTPVPVPIQIDEATSKATFAATKAQLDAEFKAQPTQITLASNAQAVYGEISSALQGLQESGATQIKVAFDETTGTVTITADDSEAKSTVSSLVDDINSRSVTLKVKVLYTESGNKPQGYHSGGLLAGYGGGDRIHALLEPGEFVFRKEAVRALGLERLMQLNRAGQNIRMPRTSAIQQLSIPKFASGGPVGATTTVNFHFGSAGKFTLSGSRDQVNGVTKALNQLARTL